MGLSCSLPSAAEQTSSPRHVLERSFLNGNLNFSGDSSGDKRGAAFFQQGNCPFHCCAKTIQLGGGSGDVSDYGALLIQRWDGKPRFKKTLGIQAQPRRPHACRITDDFLGEDWHTHECLHIAAV